MPITKTTFSEVDRENLQIRLIELYKIRFFRNVEVEVRKNLTKENYKTEVIFTDENIKIDEDELNSFVDTNARDIEYILSTAMIDRGDLIFTDESHTFINSNESLKRVFEDIKIIPSDSEGKDINFNFFIRDDLYRFDIHIRLDDDNFKLLDTVYIRDHYPTCEQYLWMDAFTLDLYRLMCDHCDYLLDMFGIEISDDLFYTVMEAIKHGFSFGSVSRIGDVPVIMEEELDITPEVELFISTITKFRLFWHYTCPNY